MKTEEEKFIEKTEIEIDEKKEIKPNTLKKSWQVVKFIFSTSYYFIRDLISTSIFVWLFIVALPNLFMHIIDKSMVEPFNQHMLNHSYVFDISFTLTSIYYIYKMVKLFKGR